jgi:hypothetical protein
MTLISVSQDYKVVTVTEGADQTTVVTAPAQTVTVAVVETGPQGPQGLQGPAVSLSIGNRTSTTLDIIPNSGSSITIPEVSTSEAGLMTANDKAVLNDAADYSIAMAIALS